MISRKNLEKMSNLKSYSDITKSLKKFINESKYNTLEKLIISSSQMVEKKFKIKKIKKAVSIETAFLFVEVFYSLLY